MVSDDRTEEIKDPMEILCCARVIVEGYQFPKVNTVIVKH